MMTASRRHHEIAEKIANRYNDDTHHPDRILVAGLIEALLAVNVTLDGLGARLDPSNR